jgi:DNA-binding NarL/FixJ family response regulator
MIKILIIDDNIKLRKRIKKILISKLSFISVAEASDKKEAFLEIEEKRPDLVFMDIQLAGESGLDLLKKIKCRYPFIPIAVNTNNDSHEYKVAAVQVGADYFLSKISNTINDLVLLTESVFSGECQNTSDTLK